MKADETDARVFDRPLYVARLARARGGEANALTRGITEELIERLDLVKRQFSKAAVIAAEPDHVAARLEQSGKVTAVTTLEPASDETLRLEPHSLEAVFSVFDLQAANDVPGVLVQIRRALKPDRISSGIPPLPFPSSLPQFQTYPGKVAEGHAGQDGGADQDEGQRRIIGKGQEKRP